MESIDNAGIRHCLPILLALGMRPLRQSMTTVFSGSLRISAASFGVRISTLALTDGHAFASA